MIYFIYIICCIEIYILFKIVENIFKYISIKKYIINFNRYDKNFKKWDEKTYRFILENCVVIQKIFWKYNITIDIPKTIYSDEYKNISINNIIFEIQNQKDVRLSYFLDTLYIIKGYIKDDIKDDIYNLINPLFYFLKTFTKNKYIQSTTISLISDIITILVFIITFL